MSTENEAPRQPDGETEPPKKQAGGRWRKEAGSPNPGGKRKSPSPAAPAEKPQSAVERPVNTERDRDGRFTVGNLGKPKGARHKTTLAMEALLDGEADAITRKAIELAKSGDLTALRLCMERLLPPRRERPVSIDMPKVTVARDLIEATAALTTAAATGEITPGEAADLAKLVESTARAIEVSDIAERLAKLEEAAANKHG